LFSFLFLFLFFNKHTHTKTQLNIRFSFFGISTAADHHVHHRLFNKNFGHLFTYWDRMFGTYTSPKEYPQHFIIIQQASQKVE